MAVLVGSRTLQRPALAIRDRCRRLLDDWAVDGLLVLGSAVVIPGALTKGDVDLHLCTQPDDFEAVVERLLAHLPPTSREAWGRASPSLRSRRRCRPASR